ncbi:MAG TPA: hypothetical protein VII87_03325 [Solirubrobacteraceae bacterium]
MTVGIRAITTLPAARTLVAYGVLVSFVYGTDTILFVGVSAHRLGTGPEGFGYLLAGLGAGDSSPRGRWDRLAGSRRLGVVILLGTLGYTLPTALLTVIHSPAPAFAVQVLRGAGTLVVDVLAVTALRRAIPPLSSLMENARGPPRRHASRTLAHLQRTPRAALTRRGLRPENQG